MVTVVLAASLASAEAAGQGVLYVDDDAPAGGDGSAWATAYRFLQDALAAAAGGTITEIRVAQGSYAPDTDELNPLGTGDRNATFQLLDAVTLAGGYAGPGEPDPDARDAALYETTLSGDLLGDDDVGGGNAENAYHVVTGSGTDDSAVIDGFTITAGNANGPGFPDVGNTGGGMLNVEGSPTVIDCTFRDNWASFGGGMWNLSGAPTVSGCDFVDNVAGSSGGGLTNIFANALITDCDFTGNTATSFGGGMDNEASDATISDCRFVGNSASIGGGGMINYSSSPTIERCLFDGNMGLSGGGGMHNTQGAHPTLTDCTFDGNFSSTGGGGMRNSESSPSLTGCVFLGNIVNNGSGGGMHNQNNCNPELVACIFDGNIVSDGGGGMRNETGCSPTLADCIFVNNSANEDGGGMFNRSDSSPTLVNCSFINNDAGHTGGGMGIRLDCHPVLTNCLFVENSAVDWGGGFRSGSTGSSPTLVNCTFAGNTAAAGGGYSAGSGSSGTVGHSQLMNCIFRSNEAPLGPQIALNGNHPADVTVTWSNVQGGEPDVYVEPGFTLTWGPGNIDLDPGFVDAANGDCRLAPGSPSIDAGANAAVPVGITTDLNGNPRSVDDACAVDTGSGDPPVVDMGAYEFQGSSCDLNHDGCVGINDFLSLLAAWGPCTDCGNCPADFDGDCTVGIVDLLLLLAEWQC